MEKIETQPDRLDYLLEQLQKEREEYSELQPGRLNDMEKRMLLRSLMNLRMPGEISPQVLQVQDAFLRQEAMEKGIIDWRDLPSIKEELGNDGPYGESISLWQGDITRLKADAVVNAANGQMLGCFVPCHKCIDNAIHSAAGMQLREECSEIMQKKRMRAGRSYQEPVGTAVLTKGYNLPASYVIHTVGPFVGEELTDSLRLDLKNCYESVLKCAVRHQLRSVAFCCISTGEFHFPNREAAAIAVSAVAEFLDENPKAFERVIFNVFKDEDRLIYQELLAKAGR